MANLRAGPTAGDDMATGVSELFRTRYPEMVRLADLLGADDPEDIAQEAFARLIRKYDSLRDPDAALAYVRASVCNLTRNRHPGGPSVIATGKHCHNKQETARSYAGLFRARIPHVLIKTD